MTDFVASGLVRVMLVAVLAAGSPALMRGQEGVFLSEEQAPHAVFADADEFNRAVIPAAPELREQMRVLLGATPTSIWEDEYVIFIAKRGDQTIGHAIIVEEIGKHRPITFIVGLRSDGRVNDVAVMAYREAYGGEVQSKRFLKQYREKTSESTLQSHTDIQNIAGATLSVEAASRAVKKALALAQVAFPIAAGMEGGAQP